MKKILLIAFILVSAVSFSLNIPRDVLTDTVENREPAEAKTEFAFKSKAYYFNEVRDIGEETYIYHIWSYIQEDGTSKEMAKIKLKVRGTRWRTWSTKNLWLKGTWMVEVVDMEGNFLGGKEFDVVDKSEDMMMKDDNMMSN